MWIFLFLCLLLKHNSIFQDACLYMFSSFFFLFFWHCFLRTLCYTPFICENTAFPFHSVLSLTDVFLLLGSGLGTEEGSLAMPADSCSIIQCPGILFIHSSRYWMCASENKQDMFWKCAIFFEYYLHASSSGVSWTVWCGRVGSIVVISNIMSLKALNYNGPLWSCS